MRASRLVSILLLLQARGRMTARALADEFEVSIRTIYRDIDDLSASGVPVYADRGRDGGFQLLDGYTTRLTGMTPAEAESLFLSGLEGPAAALGLAESTAAARRKLLAALPSARRADASRVAARFHLDPVDWYRTASDLAFLPQLAAAVWGAERIRIRYESWSGIADRTLAPLGLVLKAGTWYLVAIGSSVPRTYRVDAIRALEATGERFERPTDFDLAVHWAASVRAFEASLYHGTARIRLSPLGMDRLSVLAAAAIAMARATASAPDAMGWVDAEIPIESTDHAARELLKLGTEVEVLEPVALRDAMRGIADALAARYGG
ncbi:YafY family transcriptional regulator [Sphingomonas sp. BT-65]|uniref:helix-turn-helix transcriptional regulator n=1 Tax=Sphingomonas sp. BT-65 TaxID=2989821 RepID=UPI002236A1E6|nr:YafY family protein [Sphingomonas sp. BT-65]MCW4460173.1 YafY family transcriptional regulator [Sphingomonas sp. BT-65]